MFNKRALPDEDLEHVPEEKRLRKDLVDCFLGNDLSAKRTARIMKNAQVAGAEGLKDLQFRKKKNRNVSRDIMRRIFRNTKWPSPYEFQATAFKEAENKCEQQTLSILLPREFLFALLKVNDPELLIAKQEAILPDRPDLLAHLLKVAELGFPREATILAGLWVDAVPFHSDRSKSLETLTLSLCGHRSLRIPLVAFPKDMRAKGQTYEDMFEVVAWSFRVLLSGTMRSARHDGSAFNSTDAYRRKQQGKTGKTIALKASLSEMRADWAGYKEVLDFSSWSSKGFICWRCNCQRDSLKRFGTVSPDLTKHFLVSIVQASSLVGIYWLSQFLGRNVGSCMLAFDS